MSPLKTTIKIATFSSHLRFAAAFALALIAVFAAYVLSEKRIDSANEQRYQSYLLADELRQSSDDLTRMVRTYVLTGEPAYRQHYFDILDIRDGRKPRPGNYGGIYWDTVDVLGKTAGNEGETRVPLVRRMELAGFSPEELKQLTLAKKNSDALTSIEREAMALVAPPGPDLAARRLKAGQLLHDAAYHHAKAGIMAPIGVFYQLSDQRTLAAVRQAENNATLLRMAFVLVALGLLWALRRSFKVLDTTLGGPVDAIHEHITRIGQGHFTDAITLKAGSENSVLGWLAQTQRRLNDMVQAYRDSEARLSQSARLNAALSDCNQAIVRSTSERQLFELVCRSAVDHGGMKMAWIGLLDLDKREVKEAVAYGAGAGTVADLHVVLDGGSAFGRGPTAVAILSDAPCWCQDYQRDPITSPWHAQGVRHGWGASAALPLHRNGQVVGTFNVYVEQAGAFDKTVQALLMEMALDIDFGLKNMDREAVRALAEVRTAESETRLARALEGSQDALWDWGIQRRHLYYSPRWWQMLGYAVDQFPVDSGLWRRFMHPEDVPGVDKLLRDCIRGVGDSFSTECRLQHRDGHYIPVLVRGLITRDASGQAERVSGTNMDLTERVRKQQMDALRSFMLEQLTSSLPLDQVMRDFVLRLEDVLPGAVCTILLLDGEGLHLQLGAAPSLPDFYNQAIDGVQIGAQVGSCGAAAFTGRRAVVGDIASDPNWVAFREVAAQAGLASCWSEPILSGSAKVLGTFAIYHHVPCLPDAYEIGLIEMAAILTAIAIERKNAELQLQLVAKVFEQGNEVIMITDSHGCLMRVNDAFLQTTGYTEAEALGRSPSMLSSGRHDKDFYRIMWDSLLSQGHWQGEIWNRRKDGSVYPEWLSISTLRDGGGTVTNYIAIATDISKSKEDEAHIRQLADFDPLTGLPNRRLLQDRVQTALSHAQRNHESLAIMFLDLDRFKNVNDSLGHQVGDELLVQVAQRLKAALREQDTVCRLGGDEFVILCSDTDASGAAHVASKLMEATSPRYLIQQQELAITFSIGIALFPADGDTFEELSMRADTAMYRAKQTGRNAYRFFTTEMQAQSTRALQLENALSRALEHKQLHLVYQPQVSLRDGRVVGAEALLRWTHPTLGHVSPAEFIPVAEDSGLILPIGEWVLRTAARQLQVWQAAGLSMPLVAVNLSAVQFRQANLPDLVSTILDEVGLPPQCLELELTESVAMGDPVGAITIMDELHRRGVRMSIDDFGTGYSSLSYLKRFQVYKLKIDQSFVRDITDDPDDKAIVGAIIGLARSLGFQTIAEGVETPGQLEFLREQGCDEVQGYFFSKPLASLDFEAFVQART